MLQPLCPNCARDYTKRVSRIGFKERLLSIIYVYPFRCQLCGYRFSFMQRGVRYRRVEEDRREYNRMPASFPVSFACDGIEATGHVLDISLNGCTVEANTVIAEGSIVRMALQMSEELAPIGVEAALVRDVNRDRIGIEFLRFQYHDRERLQIFIRRLLNGIPEPSPRPSILLNALKRTRHAGA
jgi:DNA-directed RNA polymerase subunit RPC12/RpoP